MVGRKLLQYLRPNDQGKEQGRPARHLPAPSIYARTASTSVETAEKGRTRTSGVYLDVERFLADHLDPASRALDGQEP